MAKKYVICGKIVAKSCFIPTNICIFASGKLSFLPVIDGENEGKASLRIDHSREGCLVNNSKKQRCLLCVVFGFH